MWKKNSSNAMNALARAIGAVLQVLNEFGWYRSYKSAH